VRRAIAGFIEKKLEQAADMTLSELIAALVKQDSKEWIIEQLSRRLKMGDWLDQLAGKRLDDLLGGLRERLLAWVPGTTDRLILLLQTNAERAIASIELPSLVEAQVAKFPIERLEHIILSVSGKEFRAITWLGVLLGGIIGLLQSLVIIWTGRF
jgi:uncharacterized membrane protein YheB (UPF0754 family)